VCIWGVDMGGCASYMGCGKFGSGVCCADWVAGGKLFKMCHALRRKLMIRQACIFMVICINDEFGSREAGLGW
jgi:hypothetical protein